MDGNSEAESLKCCIACLKDKNLVKLEDTFNGGIKEVYKTLVKCETIDDLGEAVFHICGFCKETLQLIEEFQKQCTKSLDYLKAKLSVELVVIKEEKNDVDYEQEETFYNDSSSSEEEEKIDKKVFSAVVPLVKLKKEEIGKHAPKVEKINKEKKEELKIRAECTEAWNTKDFRYYCKYCEKSYGRAKCLTDHVLKKHKGGLTCKYCRYIFLDKIEFEQHMKYEEAKERPETMYCCDQCGHTTKTKPGLKVHLRLEHSDEPELICDVCGKQYKLREHFKTHFISAHMEKRHQCTQCHRKFAFEIDLKKHGKLHDENPAGPDALVTCQICNNTMKQSSVYAHIRTVHLKATAVKCKICSKEFSTPKHLRRHLEAHANNTVRKVKRPKKVPRVPKPFVEKRPKNECKECGEKFWKKEECRIHYIEKHIDAETFKREYVQCEICKNKYKKRWFHMHMEEQHNSQTKIPCDECSSSFTRKSYLLKHKRLFH